MSPVRLVLTAPVAAMAALLFAVSADAQAVGTDPLAVLKAAGLTRSGNSFVLDGELEANKLERSVGQLQAKVIQGRREQQQGQQMLAQAQDLRAQAQEWYRDAQRRSEESRRPRSKDKDDKDTRGGDDGSTSRARAVSLEADARRLELQAQKLLDPKVDSMLNEYTRQIQEDQGRYQNLVDQTLTAYEQLYKQDDVMAALRKLNHLSKRKVALGPIPQYVQNLAHLCSEQLVDMGLTFEKDLFFLADEAILSQEIADFALKYRKAKQGGEVESGMEAEVKAFRERANQAEAKSKQLAGDTVVKDLLAEVQKAQNQKPKVKVRVGTSLKLARALNDLKSIEKDFATPAKK